MSLRIRPLQNLQLSLKAKIVFAVCIISAILIIKFLFISTLLKPNTANADTCLSTYTLDWGDPTTYTVTCGSVNAGNWSVKGMTCFYFSPVINVGGAVGGPNGVVDISVRINQSGNVDNNDTAMVYFYNNGVITHTDVFVGAGSPAVFISTRTLSVSPGGTFQVSIELKNDKTNELWQVKNGDVTACVRGISPLPVSLIDFKVAKTSMEGVLLNWTTASEVQNDYFTIEHSINKIKFSEIARIKGAGNSNILKNYSYTDQHPFAGTSYYRLKQTDYNGQTETFKTLAVTLKNTSTVISNVMAFPNPFNEQLNLNFDAETNGDIIIELINTNGAKIYSKNFSLKNGNNFHSLLKGEKISKGIYLLRIINNGNVLYTSRIIRNDS